MPSALVHGHHLHTSGMQVHFDRAPVVIGSQDQYNQQQQEEYEEEEEQVDQQYEGGVGHQAHEREDIDDEEEEDEDRGAGEDDLKRE